MEETKCITINGFDFIITKEIDFNNNHYMLAIDEKGEDTIAILKQKIINGVETVESVTEDDEIEMVFELLRQENERN